MHSARIETLLSVVFRGDDSQLANVEAVSDGYPLRGTLLVADQPFATGTATRDIPAPGRGLAELQADRHPGRRHRHATVDRRGDPQGHAAS